MIPKGFRHEHFLKAAIEIDVMGIPELRQSKRYDLLLNGKKYPPKYLISIAYKFLEGKEFPSENFNAVETKDYFIRRGYRILDRKTGFNESKIISEDEESNFPEGKEKFRKHRYLERDTSIIRKAKELRLDQVGELRCDVCKFSFSDIYGEQGAGFIEAHHTIPISEIGGKRKTKIEEIALVCSNCHKMLHIGGRVLSVMELRNIIIEQKMFT